MSRASAAQQQPGSPPAVGLKLELGHSCYRHLTWDCVLGSRGAAAWLVRALPRFGYVETSDSDLVRVFESPEHHSVVVVPRTGRVQIRIHYLTREEDRPDAATRVADVLAAALQTPVS